ncbi:hypothetical protein, partial [Demequina sp.]|uniref:hypothetical protein n=1 Tax=Demequina sp. TaxID=2050685 RepID=UPI0025DF5426
MRPLPPGSAESLLPLRQEILARATSAARTLDQDASRRAEALLLDASRDADAIGTRAAEAGAA